MAAASRWPVVTMHSRSVVSVCSICDLLTSNTQLFDALRPAAVNVSKASWLMVLPDTICITRCGLLSLHSYISCVSPTRRLITQKGLVCSIQRSSKRALTHCWIPFIADIFTAILMRDDLEISAPPISLIAKRKFFLQFITWGCFDGDMRDVTLYLKTISWIYEKSFLYTFFSFSLSSALRCLTFWSSPEISMSSGTSLFASTKSFSWSSSLFIMPWANARRYNALANYKRD